MTRFLIPAICVLLIATAASADVAVTGQKGVTILSTRSCAQSGGLATCTRDTSVTSSGGAISMRQRVTTGNRDGATSTLTGTRIGGATISRTARISR